MTRIIPQGELTIEVITRLLDGAFISCSIDDEGDIYVHQSDDVDFPIWITVDEDKGTIRFFTFVNASEDETFTPDDAHHLSFHVSGPQFWASNEGDRLWAAQHLLYQDGVIDAHIVRMTKRFSGAVGYGCSLLRDRKVPKDGIRLVS